MPKSFLLCPNRKRELEAFIRGELSDSYTGPNPKQESEPQRKNGDSNHLQNTKSSIHNSGTEPGLQLTRSTPDISTNSKGANLSQLQTKESELLLASERIRQPAEVTWSSVSSQSPIRILNSARQDSSPTSSQQSSQNVMTSFAHHLSPTFPGVFSGGFHSQRSSAFGSPRMLEHALSSNMEAPMRNSLMLELPQRSVFDFPRENQEKRLISVLSGRPVIEIPTRSSNMHDDGRLSESDTDFQRTRHRSLEDELLHRRKTGIDSCDTVQLPNRPIFPFNFKPNAERLFAPGDINKQTLIVDSNIPFTTYLQNLTKTLRESSASKNLQSENADFRQRESTLSPRREHFIPTKYVRSPSPHREIDEVQKTGIKRKHSGIDVEENSSETSEEDSKETAHEDDRQTDTPLTPDEDTPMKRKVPPPLFIPRRLEKVTDGLELTSRHPLSAPVFSGSPFPLPGSGLSALVGHSPHALSLSVPPPSHQPQHQQQQQQQQHLHIHHHDQRQFPSPGIYREAFPQTSSNTSSPHPVSLGTQLMASLPPVGFSPLDASMGNVFHPAFLGFSGMSMRRASVDKPPPVKKYKCDVCQKAFSRSNTLVTHKRIHTGDKPFKCEVCGRAFRQPGNLTRHRLTHTTHKPYVCHICSKAFNRASNLNTHIRTHTTFRQYTCPVSTGKYSNTKLENDTRMFGTHADGSRVVQV